MVKIYDRKSSYLPLLKSIIFDNKILHHLGLGYSYLLFSLQASSTVTLSGTVGTDIHLAFNCTYRINLGSRLILQQQNSSSGTVSVNHYLAILACSSLLPILPYNKTSQIIHSWWYYFIHRGKSSYNRRIAISPFWNLKNTTYIIQLLKVERLLNTAVIHTFIRRFMCLKVSSNKLIKKYWLRYFSYTNK